MKIKDNLGIIFTFVKEHKLFTLFVVSAFLLNLFLLIYRKNDKTEYITCSTYDKGIAGTYGLFRDLEDRGVPVKRLKLPIFKEFGNKEESNRTLVILSPTFVPGQWEWEMIMEWVAEGNRLITSGFIGPKKMGFLSSINMESQNSRMSISQSNVLLPVDSIFPYDESLAALSSIEKAPITGMYYRDSDSALIQHFTNLGSNVLPFITYGNKVTALKKAVGKGEWVIFAERNPFSNSILRHPSWYRFTTRLFTGDPKYEGKMIFFDEFHNGHRATKSLWQIVTYYKFDSGFIYISILILLYLFLTGIRIATPATILNPIRRDSIHGIKTFAQLLFKYRSFKSIANREINIIKETLFQSTHIENRSTEEAVDLYLTQRVMPSTVKDKEELVALLKSVELEFEKLTDEDITKAFNTLMLMRKELKK